MAKRSMKSTDNPVKEIVEKPVAEIVTGKVKCAKLNVRKEPNTSAQILGVVSEGDKLTIDPIRSTGMFFKVTTESGLDGYCMRRYVSVK